MLRVESELDNALVRQKNAIFTLINNGLLDQAEQTLEFVRHLWAVCGYDYKYHELEKIIEECKRDNLAA